MADDDDGSMRWSVELKKWCLQGDLAFEEQSACDLVCRVMDTMGRYMLCKLNVALGLDGGESTMEKALMDPNHLPKGTHSSSHLSLVRYKQATPCIDCTLFTFIHAEKPGLQVLRQNEESGREEWIDVDCTHKLIAVAGSMLEKATAGAIRAVRYRVVTGDNDEDYIAVVWKVKARSDAILDPLEWNG